MKLRKVTIGAVGALLALVVSFVVATPAHAANSPSVSPTDTTSQGSDTWHTTDPWNSLAGSCLTGELCIAVWDPNTGSYKAFAFEYCQTFYVSWWGGTAYIVNDQWGSPTSRFYGQFGGQLISFTPSTTPSTYNVNDVWSLRPC